jgi:hypothetical protein
VHVFKAIGRAHLPPILSDDGVNLRAIYASLLQLMGSLNSEGPEAMYEGARRSQNAYVGTCIDQKHMQGVNAKVFESLECLHRNSYLHKTDILHRSSTG